MKGTAPDEFQRPMQEKLNYLVGAFCNATPIDNQMFSKQSPYSMMEIADGDPELTVPHGKPHKEWVKNAKAQAAVLEEEFTQAIRDEFTNQAKDYIRQHGPEALRTMLSAPETGFIAWMRDKRTRCEAMERQNGSTYNDFYAAIRGKHTELKAACHSFYDLLKRGKIFEQYLAQLATIYTSKQNELCYQAIGKAIETVTNEIQTQILERNLKFTIDALTQIKQDLDDDVQNIPTSAPGVVLNMEQLKQQIVATYQAEDNQKKLMAALLETAADAAISFDNTGVSVETAASTLITKLDNMIDTIFKAINDSSLARQLVQFGSVNAEGVADYVKENIAPMLCNGAQVHFNLDRNFGGLNTTNTVKSSYISIPAGADEVRKGVTQFISSNQYSGAVIKNSIIDDRIFWMNIVSGLPLCALRYLPQYELTYEEQRKRHPGIHLVTMNDDDLHKLNKERTVLDDWNMLPSPVPFILLGEKPAPQSLEQDQREKHEMAKAAEEAGALKLSMDGGDPIQYRARLAFFGESRKPMSEEEFKQKLQAALASSADREKVKEALHTLLDSRAEYDLIDDQRQDQQTETFSKAESINLSGVYAQSEEAKKTCFRELAYYRLSQRPALMIELERQMAMSKRVMKEIGNQKGREIEEQAIKETAILVAKLMLYECINVRPMKVLHINALEQFETNGEDNVLFGQGDVLQKELWANYLPIQVKLTEWYAKQNHEDEPFHTIEEIMKARFDKSMDPDNSPEDRAMCKAYKNKADEIVKSLEKENAVLRQKQKELPREEYDKALMILEEMIKALNGWAHTWLWSMT